MALLDAALKGRVEILVSPALVLEYEAVLTRDEHLHVAGMTVEEIGELLDAICRAATAVRILWHWRPQLADEDDELVLETAINGHAQAIVTFNRTDFENAAKRFGLSVLSPSTALGRLTPYESE
jgi:predicted nucleic acid-binding protein